MDNNLVSDYLAELLTDYNRVSLPCLGSFMTSYKPASIIGGRALPPSKKVTFHQNEIWNDEKLEHLISVRNNISLGEAKEQVAFWIDNVCVSLATGEKIILPGLGILKVSDRSKLEFQQNSCNLLAESFGLQPIPLKEKELPQPEYGYSNSVYVKNQKSKIKVFIISFGAILLLLAAAYAVNIIYGPFFTLP